MYTILELKVKINFFEIFLLPSIEKKSHFHSIEDILRELLVDSFYDLVVLFGLQVYNLKKFVISSPKIFGRESFYLSIGMEPCVIFLMGVSGSGKATIIEHSGLREDDRFVFARSYCTRPMREGEIQGKTYRFISEEEFGDMMNNNEFVEPSKENYFGSAGKSIHIHGQYSYGTSLLSLMDPIGDGKIVVKEIDMIGLQEIMSRPQPFTYYTVFLDVDGEHVVERIKNRSDISHEELTIRIENCQHESLLAKQYCTHIINANQSIDQVTKEFLDFLYSRLV